MLWPLGKVNQLASFSFSHAFQQSSDFPSGQTRGKESDFLSNLSNRHSGPVWMQHSTAVTLILLVSALLTLASAPACKHCFSIVRVHCHSHFLTSCLSACRSQHRQFVPHGRWPGPSHGVARQHNDRRAKRRTARGAALMIPPSPCCPINSRPYAPPLLTCCMLF